MKNTIKKIISNKWILRSLLHTIYFNFKYLPLKQAVKLPILLYKPRLLKLAGSIKIEAENIHFGMIQLGRNIVSFYPNSGITIENEGNIIFKGISKICSGGCLSVKRNANLTIGNNFTATAELKLACHFSITICENVLIGWATKIFDTDFHKLTYLDQNEHKKPFGSINIGRNVWIANDCLIMKNTVIPDNCVVGARSTMMKKYDIPSYSLIAGSPATFIKTGCWLNRNDMQIEY